MTRIFFALLLLTTSLAAAERPNIVVIVADDMGYADIGTQGSKDFPTPNLVALAKSGVRFTSGYVASPYCSPTRAGLLTGRCPTRFGHEFNFSIKNAPDRGLPLTETTIADRLGAAGYRTGLVGKWHLGFDNKRPTKRGFQEFFGFLDGAHDYLKPEGILRGDAPAGEQGYLTDAFGREAVSFIDRHKTSPFFLYLAFNAVHTPLQADAARMKKFAHIADVKRRTLAAMTSAMDDAIGTVVKKLADEKLAERTLVVFFSDNGGAVIPGCAPNGAINTPLRGSKMTTLEAGVRVPFFMAWPGTIPAGGVDDRPVWQLDVMPTALALAEVEAKPEWKLDGVNLLPYVTGKNAGVPHESLCWRFGPQMAIRQGDWKLVRHDLTVEESKGLSPARLYNLKDDLSETTDLAAKQPERVKRLQAAWDEWNRGNIPAGWGPFGLELK